MESYKLKLPDDLPCGIIGENEFCLSLFYKALCYLSNLNGHHSMDSLSQPICFAANTLAKQIGSSQRFTSKTDRQVLEKLIIDGQEILQDILHLNVNGSVMVLKPKEAAIDPTSELPIDSATEEEISDASTLPNKPLDLNQSANIFFGKIGLLSKSKAVRLDRGLGSIARKIGADNDELFSLAGLANFINSQAMEPGLCLCVPNLITAETSRKIFDFFNSRGLLRPVAEVEAEQSAPIKNTKIKPINENTNSEELLDQIPPYVETPTAAIKRMTMEDFLQQIPAINNLSANSKKVFFSTLRCLPGRRSIKPNFKINTVKDLLDFMNIQLNHNADLQDKYVFYQKNKISQNISRLIMEFLRQYNCLVARERLRPLANDVDFAIHKNLAHKDIISLLPLSPYFKKVNTPDMKSISKGLRRVSDYLFTAKDVVELLNDVKDHKAPDKIFYVDVFISREASQAIYDLFLVLHYLNQELPGHAYLPQYIEQYFARLDHTPNNHAGGQENDTKTENNDNADLIGDEPTEENIAEIEAEIFDQNLNLLTENSDQENHESNEDAGEVDNLLGNPPLDVKPLQKHTRKQSTGENNFEQQIGYDSRDVLDILAQDEFCKKYWFNIKSGLKTLQDEKKVTLRTFKQAYDFMLANKNRGLEEVFLVPGGIVRQVSEAICRVLIVYHNSNNVPLE